VLVPKRPLRLGCKQWGGRWGPKNNGKTAKGTKKRKREKTDAGVTGQRQAFVLSPREREKSPELKFPKGRGRKTGKEDAKAQFEARETTGGEGPIQEKPVLRQGWGKECEGPGAEKKTGGLRNPQQAHRNEKKGNCLKVAGGGGLRQPANLHWDIFKTFSLQKEQ